MMRLRANSTTFVLAAIGLSAGAVAQGDPATISRILAEGKNRNQGMATLKHLTEKIGPRATGTPQLRRAEEWAKRMFASYGLSNVHLDQWGTIPIKFERGPNNHGRLVAPYEREFEFTTNCWTVGTKGTVRGVARHQPGTVEEVKALGKSLKGAWILMPNTVSMGGAIVRDPNDLEKALDAAGIAGRIFSSGRELVWTHGRWTDYTEGKTPRTPMVLVRKSDYDTIAYNVDKGRNPVVEFSLDNRITNREIPVSNVVAEIRGTEKPDEVVIICGHLDSWNGPGSQGASDNGTGTTVTLESARILMAAGAKPKRTIRFILWTGEEQGLLGSAAYVLKNKDQLNKISAVLNEDAGQNYHTGIRGLKEMMPILTKAVEPMKNAFPTMPVEATETERLGRGGSDHASFVIQGVPAFQLGKGGGLSYTHVWHTQNDQWSYVPEENLKQMSTNLAVLAFNIAAADELLPRVPIAQTFYDHTAVGGYFGQGGHADIGPCPCGASLEYAFQVSRLRFK